MIKYVINERTVILEIKIKYDFVEPVESYKRS